MPEVKKIQRPWLKPSTTQSEKKTDPFYTSTPWRKTRAYKIALNPLCEYCEQFNIKHFGGICDHEKPRRIFPELELELSNLRNSCQTAHDIKRNCERRMSNRSQQEAMMKEFYELLGKHYRNTR
jgi:5-methylcytosine-specific restriction endonuclease McrA